MSPTICSEKIHHPPCSLESCNQRNGDICGFPIWMAHLSISLTSFKKENMTLLSRVQCVPLAVSGVYFLKYSCLISASVTCPVHGVADTLWQHSGGVAQHAPAWMTWIINGINQHLWYGWKFAGAERLQSWTTSATTHFLQVHSRLVEGCCQSYRHRFNTATPEMLTNYFFLWRRWSTQCFSFIHAARIVPHVQHLLLIFVCTCT